MSHFGYSPDEIGQWTEIKLDILRKYGKVYSTIMNGKNLYHFYVDGFCGGGQHVSKATGEIVKGSPLNALEIDPPFKEYHLVDMDKLKIDSLRKNMNVRENVFLYEDDCNNVLLNDVLPKIEYKKYRRGLVLLDPYGIGLNWEVMRLAGSLGTIDMFLNFMIMDMNQNILWRNPDRVAPSQIKRMNAFWGDESWREAAYRQPKQASLGFMGEIKEKAENQNIVDAFRKRLLDDAGFKFVPEPLPMKNSKGAVVYYLFFAARNELAAGIVESIYKPYRN